MGLCDDLDGYLDSRELVSAVAARDDVDGEDVKVELSVERRLADDDDDGDDDRLHCDGMDLLVQKQVKRMDEATGSLQLMANKLELELELV